MNTSVEARLNACARFGARSRLRNAERRNGRVPTALTLPQPKAGMCREQVETPSDPGRGWNTACPAPNQPPPRSSLSLKENTEIQQRCRRNVSNTHRPAYVYSKQNMKGGVVVLELILHGTSFLIKVIRFVVLFSFIQTFV